MEKVSIAPRLLHKEKKRESERESVQGRRVNRYAKGKKEIIPHCRGRGKQSLETKLELVRFEEMVEDNSRGSFTRRNPAPSGVSSLLRAERREGGEQF